MIGSIIIIIIRCYVIKKNKCSDNLLIQHKEFFVLLIFDVEPLSFDVEVPTFDIVKRLLEMVLLTFDMFSV